MIFRGGRVWAPLAAVALLLVLASPVIAHAELVRAIPADGETVTEPVTIVSARYSEDLISGSRLELTDGSGTTVATGGIDPQDARRMVARPESALTDGRFTVESTARSADGHVERVTWTFTIALPPTRSPTSSGETPSPPPASSAPSPTSSPTASPSPTDPTSGSGDVLLPILAGLAIVAIAAGYLLNRSRAR